jgi:predicted enzyme related to lactoylglutathione lyase
VERDVRAGKYEAVGWIPNPYARGELVVVIDCADLERSARFWARVFGYLDEGPSTGPYRTLRPADGSGAEVLQQRTADPKQGKNRVHLDLRTRDLDAELTRVTELGAQTVSSWTRLNKRVTWWRRRGPR